MSCCLVKCMKCTILKLEEIRKVKFKFYGWNKMIDHSHVFMILKGEKNWKTCGKYFTTKSSVFRTLNRKHFKNIMVNRRKCWYIYSLPNDQILAWTKLKECTVWPKNVDRSKICPVSEKKNFEVGLLSPYVPTCDPQGGVCFDPKESYELPLIV